MTTRDELESVIWRHFPRRGPEAGEAVDAILAAADAYMVTECGLTAERRAVHAPAMADSTHYARDGRPGTTAACGRRKHPESARISHHALARWMATADPAKVTCGACKHTGAYRGALREAS